MVSAVVDVVDAVACRHSSAQLRHRDVAHPTVPELGVACCRGCVRVVVVAVVEHEQPPLARCRRRLLSVGVVDVHLAGLLLDLEALVVEGHGGEQVLLQHGCVEHVAKLDAALQVEVAHLVDRARRSVGQVELRRRVAHVAQPSSVLGHVSRRSRVDDPGVAALVVVSVHHEDKVVVVARRCHRRVVCRLA